MWRSALTRRKDTASKPGLSIVPRIREVDEFLDIQLGIRDRLRESHPEVCYLAFNGGPLAHPPNNAPGIEERREIIIDTEPDVEAPLRDAIDQICSPRYAPMVSNPSQIQDAFVGAVTACLDTSALSTLPLTPPHDARGLTMGIVYPTETRQLTLADG